MGILWGLGLCMANFVSAYLISRWAFGKSLSVFIRWVLGGMLVRLLLTSAAAIYLLAVQKVESLSFALSFALGVAVLLSVEVWDFHRRYETFRLRPITT
ncbi:MAG: hypothetical protein NZ473_02405 [Candidatus Kapabacteria bacterium]|nr:hypothetical protein [Candidatus Kapabacteria bacterium]MDW7997086.1 hypothetical protein [Bacteroidota bacterium]